MNQYTSNEILKWRTQQLLLGGKKENLDWLLDLAGGLTWSDIQILSLDENKSYSLLMSLDQLSSLWSQHLEEKLPLQYLLGICPWRDFVLEVSKSVMIPRQETELLIDFALQRFPEKQKGKWADLGTGSGALAIALNKAFPEWEGYVVDVSTDALILAKKNLSYLAVNSKYSLHLGKWWEPLKHWWGELDLVLANPPYIPSSIVQTLDPIIYLHEPHLALSGGVEGLDSLREVIAGAYKSLNSGGCLMVEHHHDQSQRVLELMNKGRLVNLCSENDLQGIKRFAIGYKP